MKFAQFQSTYKGNPLEVYEKTGEILEAKYYKNREENSQLRQYLSTMRVEDRNVGHLAKVTTDIEGILDKVNGQWQYATNALFEARERLIGDKALAASTEDYAKSQATKAEMQKRFEEGKIGQDALSAYYINEKRYNNKAIQIDANGQTTNRWYTPTAPQKIDIEKKVLDIVTQLNLHKDSIAVGNTKSGPVYELYKANPALEGFVDKYTAKGKSPETIAQAVNAWIQTTPEVKEYYNYVNDARTFDQFTVKDQNGDYVKDENGEFISKPISAADFRDLGIPIGDDWGSISNQILLPGLNGTIVSNTIRGLSPNFKNSAAYKDLREQGLSDQGALKKLYSNAVTQIQTDKIVDFGKSFAYSEFDTDTIKDEGYWFRKNIADEEEKNRNIAAAWIGKAPLLPDNGFTVEGLNKTIADLEKAVSGTKEGSYDRYRLTAQLNGIKNTQRTLRKSYAETPEGAEQVDTIYKEILNSVPDEQWSIIYNAEKQIKDYISGKRDDLGVNISGSTNLKGRVAGFLSNAPVTSTRFGVRTADADHKVQFSNLLNHGIEEFDKGYERKLQEGGINYNIDTYDFVDKDNKVTALGENLGENMISRADSWHNMAALNKQGEKMTLRDYLTDKKINTTLYKPFAQYTNQYGTFVIKFIPRKDGIDTLPDDGIIMVTPNPENVDPVMEEQLKLVREANKGTSNNVNNWLNTQTSELVYGYTFRPAKSEYAAYVKSGQDRNVEIPLHDVRISQNSSDRAECKLRINDDYSATLFQLNPETNTYINKGTFKHGIEEAQMFLTTQFLK